MHTRRNILTMFSGVVSISLTGCIRSGDSGELTQSPPQSENSPSSGTIGGQKQSWPLYQHDSGRSGHTNISSGPTGEVTERWRFSPVEAGSTLTSTTPIIANDMLFVSASVPPSEPTTRSRTQRLAIRPGRVFSLVLSTGEVNWRYSGERAAETIAAVDGTVYVSGLGETEALNIANGVPRNVRFALDDQPPSPVTSTTLFSGGESITAESTSTGETEWSFDIWGGYPNLNPEYEQPLPDDQYVSQGIGHPLVGGDTVYVVGRGTTNKDESVIGIFALDAGSGDVTWSRGFRRADPGWLGWGTLKNDTVYIGYSTPSIANSNQHSLMSLSTKDGAVKWRTQLPNGVIDSGIAATADTVYAATKPHPSEPGPSKLHSLDASTGTHRWITPVRNRVSIHNGIAVTDEAVFMPSGGDSDSSGAIQAFSTTNGQELWSKNLEEGRASAPAISGNKLYIIDDNSLYCIEEVR